jgi:carbonic anhydrase
MVTIASQFALSLLLSFAAYTKATGDGDFYTYYEEGGFGPSRWEFLQLSNGNNQCGGTAGQSGYGQSPVTIASDVSGKCDTDTESNYDFTAGSCSFDDLSFTISNNGKSPSVAVASCSDPWRTFLNHDILLFPFSIQV